MSAMPASKLTRPAQNDFASRFDQALALRGTSQNQVEIEASLSKGQISKMRSRGALRIEPTLMFALADALRVDARWLFTGEGTPTPRGGAPSAPSDTRLRERLAHLEQAMRVIETTSRGVLRR